MFSLPLGVRLFGMRGSGPVGLVQLFGAIGTFEIVALAGNGSCGNGDKQDGE